MTGLILATKRYTEQNYIDSNPTVHIEQSTLEYLYAAFSLYECKQTLNRKQYRALLEEYGWDKGATEERRSLTELINDEETDDNIDWEYKQQELESLLQKDTDNTDPEYTDKSDIDSEEDVK